VDFALADDHLLTDHRQLFDCDLLSLSGTGSLLVADLACGYFCISYPA